MKNNFSNIISDLSLKDFSVGNDIVFLPDFGRSYSAIFQKKVYTPQEVEYCELFDQPILRFASTWAAKEAVYKAVKQLRPQALAFKKIEISRSKVGGVPTVKLPPAFADIDVSVSISHDGDYACAIALARKKYD